MVPRGIAEILIQFDVKELQISLTQGMWRYEQWGYPVVDASPGAEAWAWFAGTNLTEDHVDEQWQKLAGTFSGVLCASLNFIDKTNSVEPKYSFFPQFSSGSRTSKQPNDQKFVRYSSLPREIVCTENLTPWKKLLPCENSGLVSLLNSGYVHNTNYHSLNINLRTLCEGSDGKCVLEFTETANFVYDSKLLGLGDFSIRRLFGQGLNGNCPLAKSSKIYVKEDTNKYELNPAPMFNLTSLRGGQQNTYGVYDLKMLGDTKLFNVAWIQKKNAKEIIISPQPPLTAHRYILGRGQQKGQIITEIKNNHYTHMDVVVLENIPWFVPIYMHTLKLSLYEMKSPGKLLKTLQPHILHYRPGVQRTYSYHLELGFQIPAQSTVKISIDFDYIFLKWLEYPPDANHGHYLGSSIISTELSMARNYTAIPLDGYLFAHSFNASRPQYFLRIHTESLLLSLPTPDFSMPYNVICLACTVVALAFGPIHSVATKRIILEKTDISEQNIVSKIKKKLFWFKKNKQPIEKGDNLIEGNNEGNVVNEVS